MNVSITNSWDRYLKLFTPEHKDIYFTEKYVKLYENHRDEALCVIAVEDDFCLLMPILRREIEPGYFDFETSYGYGGFITNTTQSVKISPAIDAITELLKANNYIAGFIRFHPLLSNADMCRNNFCVIDDRQTVAMDLRPTTDTIWTEQLHPKNRNCIKKATKQNLEFIADYDFEYMPQFIRLYNETMDKLSADDFYYFREQYYNDWIEHLSQNSFLAVVKQDRQVISACIVMYQGLWGHYHLSGSDRNYLHLEPNNFMLWNAAIELKRIGISFFHLGGGTNGNPENSLLKFKARFCINTKYQFSFGKMIFNPEIYSKICFKWENDNPEKIEQYKHHLLKYRY